MSDLILQLGTKAEIIRWCSDTSKAWSSSPPPPMTRRTRVVGLLPAEQVLIAQKNIPSRSESRLRQALPYSIEDDCLSDVESLAIAWQRDGDNTHLAAIDKLTLNKHYNALVAGGLPPRTLLIDALTLPWESESWSVWITPEERALVRAGERYGFACPPKLLDWFLKRSLSQQAEGGHEFTEPKHIRYWGDPTKTYLSDKFPISIINESGTPKLNTKTNKTSGTFNLLLEAQRSNALPATIRWKFMASAALLLITAGLLISSQLFNQQRLATQAHELKQSIVNQYRLSFPNEQRVVDAKLQMQQHLDEAIANQGQQHSFINFLADVAPVLSTKSSRTRLSRTLQSNSSGYKITQMHYSYSDQSPSLAITLAVDKVETLNRLQGQVEALGNYQVAVRAIRKQTSPSRGFQGDLIISSNPS